MAQGKVFQRKPQKEVNVAGRSPGPKTEVASRIGLGPDLGRSRQPRNFLPRVLMHVVDTDGLRAFYLMRSTRRMIASAAASS